MRLLGRNATGQFVDEIVSSDVRRAAHRRHRGEA